MASTKIINRKLNLNRARQNGVTLITTLVMMTMVMLLGLSAILVSKGQFNLSANVQFQAAALNQAEASATVAEQWLSTGTNYLSAGFTTRASGGLYPIGYMAANNVNPLSMSWADSNSTQVSGNANQRYLYELLATDKRLLTSSLNVGGVTATACNKVNVYRIVARGESARGATRIVQTIYSVLSC